MKNGATQRLLYQAQVKSLDGKGKPSELKPSLQKTYLIEHAMITINKL